MTWARDYGVVQDHALGLQTVNRAVANVESLAEAFELEHRIYPEDAHYWRHWTPLVPKAQGTVTPTTLIPGAVDLTMDLLGGASVVRMSAGIYRVSAPYAGAMWCDVDPLVTSATPIRRATGIQMDEASGGGVLIICMELSAGSFVNADFAFSFVLSAVG